MTPTTLPSATFRDYWELAARRKRLIAITTLTALLVAGILCLVLPKSYRSNTLVLVESQKIPEDYVKGIVGGTIEERLTMIQQQVMSRTLLTRVIDEFKLYADEVRQKGFDATIDDMRKSIKVETVGTVGTRGRSVEAFSISFAHEEPMTAMKVTAKLASQFIEENLRVREQLVEGASEFLDQELTRAKAELEVQEKAISEFKKQHMGELPEHTEINLRTHDRIQIELGAANEMVQSLTDKLKMVEKSIMEYQASGVTSGVMPGSPAAAAGMGMDPLIVRLRELERNLQTLTAEYKDSYPDIPFIKQEIEQIKSQLAGRKSEKSADGTQTMSQAKIFDPYLLGLMRERDNAKVELVTMKDRRARLTEQAQTTEARIRQAPAREQGLMTLVRDYENMRKSYQSLMDKRLSARVAESLEKRQKGEQFRIIDPANLPEKPEKPDMLRIMLIGLLAGFGLGFGAAVMVEQMNPAFRRSEEAEILLGMPVLASIPSFNTLFGGGPGAAFSFRTALPAPSNGGNGNGHGNGNGNGNGNGHGAARHLLTDGEEGDAKAGLFSRWNWKSIPEWMTKNGRGRNGERHPQMDQLSGELNLVVKWSPLSVVAEQFRVAATRLALMSAERRNTVVVVTSSVKGEGKTTTAVNLAYTLARDLGKNTLLIDCDVKCPSVHKYMGSRVEPGLAEVLNGTATVESALIPVGEWPLWILAAGNQKRRSIELSKVSRLGPILTGLRAQFDYIIVDAPPILPLADMNVLAGMADMLCLIIRAESTCRDVVQTAMNTLRPSVPVGLVMTGLQDSNIPYYMQQPYYLQLPERAHRAS